MSVIIAWLQAARPLHLLLIAAPVTVGQLIAAQTLTDFHPQRFWMTLAVAWLVQIAASFAEAWVDHRRNRKAIFGGHGRTLDTVIRQPSLPLAIAIAAGGLAVIVAVFGWVLHQSWPLLPLAAGAMVLVWLFSLPPLAVARFGGGEPLQVAYLGVYLPLIGYGGQAAGLASFPSGLLITTASAAVAIVLVAGVLDGDTDRRSERVTLPVVAGPVISRIIAALFLGGAVVSWLLIDPLRATLEAQLLVVAIPVLLAAFTAMFAGPHRAEHRSRVFARLALATVLTLLGSIAVTSALT